MPTTLLNRKNQNSYSEAEWQTRVDLAACHRLSVRFNMDEIVWNHISARIPGTYNFLLNRFGLRFDEVTASNLITLDQEGNVIDSGHGSHTDNGDINITGLIIHRGLYSARKNINCVMHSHSRFGLAVSALECGLLAVMQGAFMFHNRVSYHEYEGISEDMGESTRLAKNLGDNNAMILRNHGLITSGETVGEAFITLFYLEQACRAQIDAMSTGAKLNLPGKEICERVAQQYKHFPAGKFEWPALLRLLDDKEADYKT